MWVWEKSSSEKQRGMWEERLFSAGQTNALISSSPHGSRVRIKIFCNTHEEAKALRDKFGGALAALDPESWQNQKLAPVPPLRIRDRLIIISTDDKARAEQLREEHPERAVLQIPAALAFGTGGHATTATTLRMLVDVAREFSRDGRTDWSMMDCGAGTGVLAMSARLLGAKKIEAFDNDPLAVRAARENVLLNDVPNLDIHEGDATMWIPSQRFDLIAANIFSGILIAIMPTLAAALAADGRLILSGILREQADEVLAAGHTQHLHFPIVKTTGKWVTALAAIHTHS